MSKKPFEKLNNTNDQKGIYQCKNCKKIFLDTPKGINSKDFCSKNCETAFEERKKREKRFTGEPVFNKEDFLNANK